MLMLRKKTTVIFLLLFIPFCQENKSLLVFLNLQNVFIILKIKVASTHEDNKFDSKTDEHLLDFFIDSN